jgi:hypothetical protein
MQKPRCEQKARSENFAERHAEEVAHHSLLGRVKRSERIGAAEVADPILRNGHSYQRQPENRLIEGRFTVPEDVVGARAANGDCRPQKIIPRA